MIIPGKFEGHSPSSEDDDGGGQSGGLEDGIAVGKTDVGEAGQGGGSEFGAAGNEKSRGGKMASDFGAGSEFDGVSVAKNCVAVKKREASAQDLAATMVRKIADVLIFSGDESGQVEGAIFGLQTERLAVAGLMKTVGASEECFAGHATAKDAESAKFGGTVDETDAEAEGMSERCAVVASTACADDEKIEVHGI